jgi:hypothetical protein
MPERNRDIDETATMEDPIGKAFDRLEEGCGCRSVSSLAAVPFVLATMVLVLISSGVGSSRLWVLKAVLVAVGGLLIVLGRYARVIAAIAKDNPLPEPIASLGPFVTVADALARRSPEVAILRGVIEADDAARPDDLPVAPLSGTTCLYYELTVNRIEEVFDHSDDRLLDLQEQWEQIHRQTRSVPFWLRDHTGRIAIDPSGALVGGAQGEGRREDFGPDDSEVRSLERELRDAAIAVSLPWHADEHARTIGYAVDEEVLLPGWEVTVIGPLHERNGRPVIARGDVSEPFNIAMATDDDIVHGLRTLSKRIRLAGIILPLAGAALLVVGFWLVLTG